MESRRRKMDDRRLGAQPVPKGIIEPCARRAPAVYRRPARESTRVRCGFQIQLQVSERLSMAHPLPRSFEEVRTLGDLARFNAAHCPDQEALLFQGRSTTYGQFDALTNRVANGLLREGLGAGARVAFMD